MTFQSFLFVFDVLSSNSVKSSSSLIGYDSGVDFKSISFFIFSDDFILFELLKSPSDDFSACVLVPGSSDGISHLFAINMREESNTGAGSDIDLSGEGCNSVVDPVVVKGSEFVACDKMM